MIGKLWLNFLIQNTAFNNSDFKRQMTHIFINSRNCLYFELFSPTLFVQSHVHFIKSLRNGDPWNPRPLCSTNIKFYRGYSSIYFIWYFMVHFARYFSSKQRRSLSFQLTSRAFPENVATKSWKLAKTFLLWETLWD